MSGFSNRLRYQGEASPRPDGHEGAVDQRPGVEAHAGIEPGDQRASQHLHEDQREHGPGDPCRARDAGAARRASVRSREAEQQPERVAENEQRDAEMRGEPVLADIGTLDQPALHHVPADRALKSAEHEQADQPRQQRTRDIAGEPEHDEGHEEGDADQPAEKAMRPFPPIDGLELLEAHAALELGIFRDLPVGLEGLLPVGSRRAAGWRRGSAAIR